nr:MAG TPA: hypothetical protein [Caudoviricetes sp.]
MKLYQFYPIFQGEKRKNPDFLTFFSFKSIIFTSRYKYYKSFFYLL